MKRTITAIMAGAVIALIGGGAYAADDDPRIFISADMEGIAAAVTEQQLGPGGFEYGRFREIMTDEVMAAIAGARAGGAGEIVVADSHGNMQNILVEKLPADIRLIRGGNRPLAMMEGIQAGHFDGAIYIGYHASASNTEGVRAHTMSSARLTELTLNGIPATEGLWNAAIAGHFGVPVIMVSGGNAATKEVRDTVGDMEVAAVKEAIGFHSAKTLTPEAARDLIRRKAEVAVRRIGDFKPYKVGGPVRVGVSFQAVQPAEIIARLPFIERTGARSVAFEASDMVEAANILSVMLGYDSNARP